MDRIAFGTSGWRGVIADDFTFAGVRAVSQAIAEYVKDQGPGAGGQGLVVGYDTRFLSEVFALRAAGVLAAHGVRAFLCERDTPTPVVAHEILRRRTAGGIIVTASHNPPEYNGLKFSAAWGGPALPAATRQIEERANAILAGDPVPELSLAEAQDRGLLERIDPRPAYLERLRGLLDLETIRRARLRVVMDPLYGSAQGYLDSLLREAGCELTVLHDWRDPYFGGRSPEPSEAHLRELASRVVETGADLGLATDGDADRFGLVDADGSFLEPNYFLGLLLHHLVKARGWTGGVARSVATSHLVDAVARRLDIPTYETPVGFKYVGELIAQDKVVLGGEESAGLSVKGHVPEKDGILACLLAAELAASRGRMRLQALLQELYAEVGTVLARRLNFRLESRLVAGLRERLKEPPGRLADRAVTEVKRLDGVKLILEDGSWLLLRPSGTEPVVRLYAEASTERQLDALIAEGQRLIGVGTEN
ncbi:MAG: phosphoglucomutase/phosphomannomutase family protein [candidate division NC10 bacterium]|nr:phosphoglucomutase/phosphomannomutase family protein [candidate division NC10 bacterium]